MKKLLILLLLSGLMAPAAQAAQVVAEGPWHVTVGPTGPGEIRYNGQVLVQGVHLTGFQPQWKGSRFHMGGARITADKAGATWEKRDPGNQEATVAVSAAGPKLTFTLKTAIHAAGPTEWTFVLVPEAVRAMETHCSLWVDDKHSSLNLTDTFPQLSNFRELRFEQPERTIIIRAEGALLQDRREQGEGLHLVLVIGSDGSQAKSETRAVEIEVLDAKPDEVVARRAVLSQVPIVTRSVPVPNAGFEEEEAFASWTRSPRAALDTEVKRSGKQSARITIPEEQEDLTGVYLTQQVPVRAGQLYTAEAWVKTQGVAPKELGGRHSTGGTIILEWADKEGKWLAAGAYAPGSYGNTDWKRVATKECRAPEGAAYAVLFLSMRATGTAWFDDVKLTETQRHVVLLAPGFQKVVADNTPRFEWSYAERADAILEISSDPGFPEGKTITIDRVQRAVASPEKPLPPGKYYWRVRIAGHDASSAVWEFQQTAPQDQDCTEPVIEATHAFLAEPRQAISVRYSDNVGVKNVRLVLDGRDITRRAKVGPTSAQFVPDRDWAPGLHKLDVEVADARGNQASRRLFFNRMPGVVKKEWLKSGGIAIDGKPHFLLGMYGVRREDMPEMAAAGYDFVHNYAWDGTGSNESALEYLDEAQKHGLQAFIGFNRARLQAWDEEFVAERVGALGRHPALLAWYLFDEPDLGHQYVPPDQLRALYQLIKALDPLHPVIVTVAQTHLVPAYHHSYDVYWSMDYGNTAHVASNYDRHSELIGPDTPQMSIVHCYDQKQKANLVPEKFQPGPAMLRANAFMAIAHGSSSLAWWWWGQGGSSFFTVAHVPEAWAALKETVRQIRHLRPVLEAQVPARRWVEKPAEGVEIHLWERKLPDRSVIIAVNRDEKACELTLASPLLANATQAKVLFEERAVPVREGRLTDRFEPLGVHVYEVPTGAGR